MNASSQTDKVYYINMQKVDGYEKASNIQKNNLKMAGNLYLPDGMDAKVTAFFGSNI